MRINKKNSWKRWFFKLNRINVRFFLFCLHFGTKKLSFFLLIFWDGGSLIHYKLELSIKQLQKRYLKTKSIETKKYGILLTGSAFSQSAGNSRLIIAFSSAASSLYFFSYSSNLAFHSASSAAPSGVWRLQCLRNVKVTIKFMKISVETKI